MLPRRGKGVSDTVEVDLSSEDLCYQQSYLYQSLSSSEWCF